MAVQPGIRSLVSQAWSSEARKSATCDILRLLEAIERRARNHPLREIAPELFSE
jgi:hypothetical protein